MKDFALSVVTSLGIGVAVAAATSPDAREELQRQANNARDYLEEATNMELTDQNDQWAESPTSPYR